jgi:outer membrane protein OmpA-like peptidoglycan-associated protein
MLGGCVTGNRPVVTPKWSPPAEGPQPVETVEVVLPEPEIIFAEVPEVAPVEEEAVAREHIVFESVLFDLDKAELKQTGQSEIARAAAHLEKYASDEIVIEGHTCSRGDEEHNLMLGMRRADAVRRHLVELEIEPERLTVVSYGESRPIADNSMEDNRRLNRRVMMEIVEAD